MTSITTGMKGLWHIQWELYRRQEYPKDVAIDAAATRL